MSRLTNIVTVGLSFLTLAACSPNTGPGVDGSANKALALSCAGQQKLNSDELSLFGKTQAAAGEIVMMSLNQDLGCSTDSEVQWKLSSGKVVSADKNRFVAQFTEPGRYLVEAEIRDVGIKGLSQSAGAIKILSQSTLVLQDVPVIEGPQAGLVGMELAFHIAAPAGMTVASTEWNMGEGPTQTGDSVVHAYEFSGPKNVVARVTTSSGAVYELKQNVTILDYYDDFGCLPESQIFAPQVGEVGVPVDFTVTLPACVRDFVSAVRWTFADTSSQIPGLRVQHTYQAAGTYEVKADIYSPLVFDEVLFTLVHRIRIQEPKPEVPPPKCSTLGEKRSEFVNLVTESVACGTDGRKDQEKHTEIVYECQYIDPVQDWVEISRTESVKSEGECLGQSCTLSDGSSLPDGASRLFFESSTPVGSCGQVQSSRLCQNGVLSGNTNHQSLTCNDGCPGFGIHGHKVMGQKVGEVQIPLQCAFGETGIFDVIEQIEDRQCLQGEVKASNQRLGRIKIKGNCPVYSWKPTTQWSSCTADCGGEQSQVFECQDQNGSVSASQRCAGTQPTVKRICDGNPEAVKRDDVTLVAEEANSSNKCPKNQIGIILKTRDVVTTKSYACVDHAVKQVFEKVVPTAWVEEKYCRTYVAYRCSHDSLSNSQAQGRFDWMQKCKASVPVIREFLESFDNVKAGNAGIDGNSRVLYPTFMNAGVKPEKPWIAPTSDKAGCTVPAKVYVSAVCVSSCATPEQIILTEIKNQKNFAGQSFVDALTQKTAHLVTLSEDSSLDQMQYEKTAVSSWVTELVDGHHDILHFQMKSGGSLKLTPNHPLVSEDGMMREAGTFKVGNSLIKMGGVTDQIIAIDPVRHYGKVYNVFPASSHLNRNLVITGGYINGSAFFQNEGADHMNRQILRRRLVDGAFTSAGAQ